MPPSEQHAAIRDFSDRELLAIVADLNGGSGTVTVQQIALRVFGLEGRALTDEETLYFERCVTSRFVWMRRYGLLVKGETKGEWSLSAEGDELRKAGLAQNLVHGIENMADDRSLALAHEVGERLVRTTGTPGQAMQRELQFQITRRRAIWRGRL